MEFQPHVFGRYIIIDPIASGGMAEVYRARSATEKEGPDRLIVIKKVKQTYSCDTEFIEMFENEIRVTLGLSHPNIIQIYDHGKIDGQYFMAMEYITGKTLRQFTKRLSDKGLMFGIDTSCHVIEQVCQALAYAHSFTDPISGRPLFIVHRDVSPQNIMITYEGGVKLFDFGIAKTKGNSNATQVGVIKGKPAYLAPEQIRCEELDGRCDIFAAGVILWELLTAKRLFVSDLDLGVLDQVMNAEIAPPSRHNREVPPELDAIVLRALERDREKRYQNAEELQRDLHRFLYSFNAAYNPADMANGKELFKEEIQADKERLAHYLKMKPDVKPSAMPEAETLVLPAKPTRRAVFPGSHVALVAMGILLTGSIGYLAYTKYEEKRQREELAKRQEKLGGLVDLVLGTIAADPKQKQNKETNLNGITISFGNATEERTPAASPSPAGYLNFSTTPAAQLTIYSDKNEVVHEGLSPLEKQPLPPGKYKVVIEHSLLNLHSEELVEIRSTQTTAVRRELQNKPKSP